MAELRTAATAAGVMTPHILDDGTHLTQRETAALLQRSGLSPLGPVAVNNAAPERRGCGPMSKASRDPPRWSVSPAGSPTRVAACEHLAPATCCVASPFGATLPGAHAVDREARIMSALAAAGVPVPRVYGLCCDDAMAHLIDWLERHVPGDEAAIIHGDRNEPRVLAVRIGSSPRSVIRWPTSPITR